MGLLTFQNIRFLPSIHQRSIFADEVRGAAERWAPDAVAVELHPSLETWLMRGVLRLPQLSAVYYPAPGQSGALYYVPVDPSDAIIEALRLALERELAVGWLDVLPPSTPPPCPDLPDDWMIEKVGLETYAGIVLPHLASKSEGPGEAAEARRRGRRMAARLVDLARRHRRVLCVLGLGHFAAVRGDVEALWGEPLLDGGLEADDYPRLEGCRLAHLHRESIPEILRETPYFAYLREVDRDEKAGGRARFDKSKAVGELFRRAERRYRDRYRQSISLTASRALYQYTRNLALTGGRLQPECYELVVAAKSAIDGDFGYEVHELARSYPFQETEAGLPTLRVHRGRASLSDREERFQASPAWGAWPTERFKVRLRRRPPEELKIFWREQWRRTDLSGICSWPPEDERQERFMMFLRKRALEVVTSDKRQVLEFTTSLLDGLDLRETLRNWHSGKLYVHQTPQPQGRVGAVILIFDDPANDARYPWRCTLYAENQNESDISFYATPLGENVVGPNISRTEFGGLLSIYPSTRIPDIWRVAPAHFEASASGLVAAGICFSEDRLVAYVAARPPESWAKRLAARFGKRLIYLPLAALSAERLKRIRSFHILNGRHARSYAADYIFDE